MPVLSEDFISQQLAQAYSPVPGLSPFSQFLTERPRPAAVLIPFFHKNITEERDHIWNVLLTRRTNSVAEHQGQVAFPGGRADPTDISPEGTALREAQEEIGLDPGKVRILGKLSSMWTITNYQVTPVVGVIAWPFPLKLEKIEVSRVFSVPLEWLADPAHHETRPRLIPPPYAEIMHQESHPVIYFKPYKGETLWGVSAEITMRLVRILFP